MPEERKCDAILVLAAQDENGKVHKLPICVTYHVYEFEWSDMPGEHGIGYTMYMEPFKRTGLFIKDDFEDPSMGYDSVVSGAYFSRPDLLKRDIIRGIMSRMNEYLLAPPTSMCLGEYRNGKCHGESAWITKVWFENLDEVAEKLAKKILHDAERLAEKLWGLTL